MTDDVRALGRKKKKTAPRLTLYRLNRLMQLEQQLSHVLEEMEGLDDKFRTIGQHLADIELILSRAFGSQSAVAEVASPMVLGRIVDDRRPD